MGLVTANWKYYRACVIGMNFFDGWLKHEVASCKRNAEWAERSPDDADYYYGINTETKKLLLESIDIAKHAFEMDTTEQKALVETIITSRPEQFS